MGARDTAASESGVDTGTVPWNGHRFGSLILPPAIFAMLIGAIHRYHWQVSNALVAAVPVVVMGTGAQDR